VTWSYTYTRPGYNKKQHPSVPKDWWTEDVAELDLDLFRSIISTVRSTKTIPPPLIGEALHVYTCKHLPDPLEAHSSTQSSASRAEETLAKQRRILESIVGMIPGEPGSVSCRFLLRLSSG
ncbi:BTB/POZ domain-containing protein, partial [Ananas comosus]